MHLSSIHLETKYIQVTVEILCIKLSHLERNDEDSSLKVEFYTVLCFRVVKERKV